MKKVCRLSVAKCKKIIDPVSLILLLFSLAGTGALRMTSLEVPQHVVFNQSVRMECNFNLDTDTLYSVKWYKDGQEFYRYVPKVIPNVTVFQTPGINVDMRSTEKFMILNKVDNNSTGRYRCEVSTEAPFFHTVSDHADMTVVTLPDLGPKITGGKEKYLSGDVVRVNCTSPASKPPAQLAWYVNDKPVEKKFQDGPYLTMDKNGLEKSHLSLNLPVSNVHFRQGDMKLKCLATISSIYSRSNEQRLIGDEFNKQPMESRETRAQGHTRNDANSGGVKYTSWFWCSFFISIQVILIGRRFI